jgi:2-dehydropantoate 2-reductase
MKVVIVGAGGLGSYIGAVQARAGHDVTLVARGAHAKAIEADGLRVLSHAGDFTVHPKCVASALDIESADLVFAVVKTFSLDEVAPQLAHLARAGAPIVSLLNGVTATERLVRHGIDAVRVVDGVAYMTAFRLEPGLVERKAAHQRIVVGSAGGKVITDLVAKAFGDTLVDVTVADDIRVELWEKMAVVCSLSVLCAVGGRQMGTVRGHEFGVELQRRAIGEVIAVGRAHGVLIPLDAEDRIDTTLDRFPDDFFPSVIHDLNGDRRTEMGDLGGVISRMGREAGVETPLHDAGTCAVQVAEVSPLA